MTAVTAMLAPPNWSTVDREVACPLCGYNLRGLVEPRCPECGYRFDWEPLILPRPVHAHLFEHHPEQNVRSFFRTMLAATLRPDRFWTTLQPTDPPRASRLLLYWLLAQSLMLLAATAIVLRYTFEDRLYYVALAEWPDAMLKMPWFKVIDLAIRHSHLLAAAVLVFWPILTGLLVLAIFRTSLGRAKIRAAHVWRCAIYAGEAALLGSVFIVIGDQGGTHHLLYVIDWKWVLAVCLSTLLACVTALRLGIACSRYLRLDHPYAVAMATQIILFLATLAIACNVWQ
jgi:hypothetical protein